MNAIYAKYVEANSVVYYYWITKYLDHPIIHKYVYVNVLLKSQEHYKTSFI